MVEVYNIAIVVVLYFNYVETPKGVFARVFFHVIARASSHGGSLIFIHGAEVAVNKGGGIARFYLNKNKAIIVEGNDVNFSLARPEIALENFHSARQVFCGGALAFFANLCRESFFAKEFEDIKHLAN